RRPQQYGSYCIAAGSSCGRRTTSRCCNGSEAVTDVGHARLYERTAALASVRVNGMHLRPENARRGWRAIDLARAAGVSAGTMTGGMKGSYVSPRTLQKIAVALTKGPVVPGLDELLEASGRADA